MFLIYMTIDYKLNIQILFVSTQEVQEIVMASRYAINKGNGLILNNKSLNINN